MSQNHLAGWVAEPPERVAAYSNWDHHLIRLHGDRSPVSSQFIVHQLFILVGAIPTPLKNMSSSVGMMTFPILMEK